MIICYDYVIFFSFSEEGIVVGYKALAQADHNPRNTLYDAKRFIGKPHTQAELSEAQKQYSFKVRHLINNLTRNSLL